MGVFAENGSCEEAEKRLVELQVRNAINALKRKKAGDPIGIKGKIFSANGKTDLEDTTVFGTERRQKAK